ncbi:MAG: type II secretion system F family protein [Gemmataceae bacterium]|nr:type II secretion system F family protein [Gemmataceae bacterium]MDW8264909.1 type II secretion system F family protein [Gemmataceae bacterium]
MTRETLIQLLIVGLVAVVGLAIFFLVRFFVERRRALVERRLNGHDTAPSSLLGDIALPPPPRGWAARMDAAFDRMIQRTGLGLTPEQALGIMALLAVVLGGAMFLWRPALWTVGLAGLIGLAIPMGLFLYYQSQWRRQLQEQLPDAFFLLARSLRAGLALEQSMEQVARYGNQPLADEFRRGVEQLQLGLSVPAVLQLMANRIQLTDFNVFVSAVGLHRTTGGNLAQLLDRVAASARDRSQFHGQVRAATALSRTTAGVIAGAAPVILLYYLIVQPEFTGPFFDSRAGIIAVVIALTLEIIGIVWLYFLLRLDY